jgi:hypothetical protein
MESPLYHNHPWDDMLLLSDLFNIAVIDFHVPKSLALDFYMWPCPFHPYQVPISPLVLSDFQ